MASNSTPPFGKQFRLKYFGFDPEYVPLNHGSFGAAPTPVAERRAAEIVELTRNPDKYLRFTIADRLDSALDAVAPYVGLAADDTKNGLVFVANATTGVNTVLRSFPFAPRDAIIYASSTYGACAKTVQFVQSRVGLKTYTVHIDYPFSNTAVVDAYAAAIDQARSESPEGTVVVLFDAVSSQPGCKLPWKELTALCKAKSALSLVDAAHGVGLLTDLDLDVVQPDFFVTNLHKWFFVPGPSALLYVAKQHRPVIQTFPISHSYIPESSVSEYPEATLLRDKFRFVGTSDYTTYISTLAAIDFRKNICGGEQNIQDYTFNLARQAAALFQRELATESVTSLDDTDTTPTAMINVYLPSPSGPLDSNGKIDLAFAADDIQYSLLHKRNVYFPIGVLNGRLYTRLSAQVYLELADFEAGLQAFKAQFAEYQAKYAGK